MYTYIDVYDDKVRMDELSPEPSIVWAYLYVRNRPRPETSVLHNLLKTCWIFVLLLLGF